MVGGTRSSYCWAAGMLAWLLLLGTASPAAADGVVAEGAGSAEGTMQDPAARASLRSDAAYGTRFWRPALEIFGVNTLVWSYDRYVRAGGGAGFRISPRSWGDNLNNGFEWDDNNFGTNQFAHPYHGSLYFNAARSNGHGFWECLPFNLAGSAMWEYFGETHNPSINDWVATSVSGAALGESLWRLSSVVLDNEATGASRFWRELGGFVINPMRGFNRLLSGESRRVHVNPEDRFPTTSSTRLEAGYRTIGETKDWDTSTTRFFLDLDFSYGDPFAGDYEKPFEHFDLSVQVNFSDRGALGRAQTSGLLAATVVRESESTQHILAAYQHYDYMSNSAYELGGQSVGASYLSRFETARGMVLDTVLHLNAILLGAAESDFENFSGREYDFGSGAGFKFSAAFGDGRFDYLTVGHDQFWIRSLNGNDAGHLISFTRANLTVPVVNFVALGAEFIYFSSRATYADYATIEHTHPEGRVFVAWDFE